MMCPIATEIADPIERLLSIKKPPAIPRLAGTVKDVASDFTLLGAPILMPGLAQLYGRSGLADVMPSTTNLTISNVPGPPIPVFCAGAKVLAMYPVSIPVHGIALTSPCRATSTNWISASRPTGKPCRTPTTWLTCWSTQWRN